jgi:hypothetical protein
MTGAENKSANSRPRMLKEKGGCSNRERRNFVLRSSIFNS